MQNPEHLRYSELADKLPELPDNFEFDESEPQAIKKRRLGNEPAKGAWSKEHWRYYKWSYYRNIENLDAEIGRILQALEAYSHLEDTLVVLTSDHGEGMAHHQMVRKNTLYDEAARVPLIFSWPGHIQRSRIDSDHLVSGLDIMPTLCDYAGIRAPENMRGVSLRPILEGKPAPSRDFIVTEVQANTGRMVRTNRYKYVTYIDEPRQQLFDMKGDPGETRNLAADARYASVVADHRELLYEWESRLDVAKRVPHRDAWRGNV
jgi:choline-sulfatase